MKNKYREKPADTDRPMVRKRGKKMDEFRELLEEIWGIYDIILWKEDKTTMKQNIEELRKKYMDNPPEGMTSKDIRLMSEDELLDMDYFINDDELDDDFGKEGFYIF